MRIVHFIHRYPPALGGSEAYFARLSRFLAARGEQVQVETTTALDLEAFWSPKGRTLSAGTTVEHGVTVRRHGIRHWPGRRYLLKFLALLPIPRLQGFALPCNPIAPAMWNQAAANRDVDVVHATAFPYAWPILCGLRLARRRGVPFVLTPFLHLGDPRNPRDRTRRAYLSPAMRHLLRRADRIFVQTPVEREALLDLGLATEKLILLGMGVEPAECTGGDRTRARKRWGIRPEEVVVGHLANKSVEKGTVDLIKAAMALWQSGKPCKLLLAGPEMPNFTRFWRDLPDTQQIVRLGVLTEDEKRDFFAAIDLFALPSRSDSFGMVFLEAWANGVPCIGYRAGGVADVIHHGRDGMLVDCGDSGGLAAAIELLMTQPGERRQMGEAGRLRVLSECAWQPRLELVHDTYADLVERKRLALRGRSALTMVAAL
jgi:glycosyltransferase involved in cell wall biosynthesis